MTNFHLYIDGTIDALCSKSASF